MKIYYSVVRDDGSNAEDSIIDDYVVDTGFLVVQLDAQTGEYLHKYDNLEDYLESYPDALMTEVDYEG